jgi:hypothetical protein
MKYVFFAYILLSVVTTGCLSDSKKMEPPQPVQAAPTQIQPVETASPSTSAQQPNGASAQTAVPPVISTSNSSVKLNPAHGLPGHRCDISVGAPLDSKPAQPAATPTQTTTQATPQVITAPVTMPQPTGKGLNPAHGQPGHRCDIAVGAPLDSKPTQ